ncbi:MAG: hypothetical protein RIQ93_1264 [Verrucomicrobiota bacterium]|jgi:GT2 family glycosyltransferase
MRLAITIATRNRRAELERTCAALARLEPPADEFWICADGCDDDTVEWVRRHCPEAQLMVHAQSRHSIRSRDEMLGATDCDIVVGLDDDSYPLDKDFVSVVKARFAAWPDCAVLSFPQRTDEFPGTLAQADFGPTMLVGTYVNAASAIRRQAYLDLGGWPLFFEHAADEPDFALRCIASGWQVIHDTSIIIRHHWSALMRNEVRVHHRHARNELWSVLLRCPCPWWPLVALRRAAGQFGYACRRGPSWMGREPLWWWEAAKGFMRVWQQRQSLEWSAYSRWRQLLRNPQPVAEKGVLT